MSQNFDMCPSFCFMTKYGKLFLYFVTVNIRHINKYHNTYQKSETKFPSYIMLRMTYQYQYFKCIGKIANEISMFKKYPKKIFFILRRNTMTTSLPIHCKKKHLFYGKLLASLMQVEYRQIHGLP